MTRSLHVQTLRFTDLQFFRLITQQDGVTKCFYKNIKQTAPPPALLIYFSRLSISQIRSVI